MEHIAALLCWPAHEYACLHSPGQLIDWLHRGGALGVFITAGFGLATWLAKSAIEALFGTYGRLRRRGELLHGLRMDFKSTLQNLGSTYGYEATVPPSIPQSMREKFAEAKALQCDYVPFTVVPLPSFMQPLVTAEFTNLPHSIVGGILDYFSSDQLLTQCIRELREDPFKLLELDRKERFMIWVVSLVHSQIASIMKLEMPMQWQRRKLRFQKAGLLLLIAGLFVAITLLLSVPAYYFLAHPAGWA